jgi:hypothetical protein
MIVEHTFVTVQPREAVFGAAEELLARLAFRRSTEPGAGRAWCRGHDAANRAHYLNDLPQRVRMDFDRGHVAVAAAVDMGNRRHELPQQLMVALTLALERALALAQPMTQAREDVDRIHARILKRDRRVRWTGRIIVGLIVAAFAAGVIAAAMHRH